MILNFCAVCGTTEDLHQHHIVPRSVSFLMEEHKDNDETITLCAYHHDIIHEVKRKRWDTHSNMVKEGLAKRRAKGLRIGKNPTLTREMVNNIKQMFADGVGVREIMRTLKIGTKAYYFVVRNNDSVIDEYLNSVSNGNNNIMKNIPGRLTRKEYLAIKKRGPYPTICGRKPSLTPEMVNKIQKMINQGYSVRETLRTLKIGPKTYYFVAKNDSETINKHLEQIGNQQCKVDNSFVNLASNNI